MYNSKSIILEKGSYKLYKCSVMFSSYYLVEGNNKRYIRRNYDIALSLINLLAKQ